MDELDEVWEQLLVEAARNGSAKGHFADFLLVKAANDEIRQKGVEQLLKAFELIAGRANRNGAGIVIESAEGHRFKVANSTVSGRSLKLRQGVRCLTVEAGWTRRPGDGIMRGNALAAARISHFGIPAALTELALLKFEDGFGWFRIDGNGLRVSIEVEDIVGHFRTFLD